ncbi:MAG TPA: hypothetical protein VFN02_13465 [Ktedonobacteraceae bacterium]|nr:hypothetical protein [Ktedonobacteraceae bacterium]
MKLPPVWWRQSTTPVKAKTSVQRPAAPVHAPPGLCTALTRCGLLSATHTGSRERGGGLRQTLDRQASQGERLMVGRKDATGTAWATPLAQTPPALARDLAALKATREARQGGVPWTQAACWRGA